MPKCDVRGRLKINICAVLWNIYVYFFHGALRHYMVRVWLWWWWLLRECLNCIFMPTVFFFAFTFAFICTAKMWKRSTINQLCMYIHLCDVSHSANLRRTFSLLSLLHQSIYNETHTHTHHRVIIVKRDTHATHSVFSDELAMKKTEGKKCRAKINRRCHECYQ